MIVSTALERWRLPLQDQVRRPCRLCVAQVATVGDPRDGRTGGAEMSEAAEAGYERFSPGCGTRHITLKWLPEFNAI